MSVYDSLSNQINNLIRVRDTEEGQAKAIFANLSSFLQKAWGTQNLGCGTLENDIFNEGQVTKRDSARIFEATLQIVFKTKDGLYAKDFALQMTFSDVAPKLSRGDDEIGYVVPGNSGAFESLQALVEAELNSDVTANGLSAFRRISV